MLIVRNLFRGGAAALIVHNLFRGGATASREIVVFAESANKSGLQCLRHDTVVYKWLFQIKLTDGSWLNVFAES